MDFGLSDDQRLLEETLRGFLADQVPIERVRELRERDCPNDRALWSSLAELGVTGVLVPEAQGGSGLALLDAALVAQSLGHAATPTPFLASGVLAPVALGAVGGPEAEAWLHNEPRCDRGRDAAHERVRETRTSLRQRRTGSVSHAPIHRAQGRASMIKLNDVCVASRNRLNPAWQVFAGGCNINRDIPGVIESAGFRVIEDERMYIPGIKVLSYNYWGSAVSE